MPFKKTFLLLAASALLLSNSHSAFSASEMDWLTDMNYEPYIPEKGEFTSDYPIMGRTVTLPIRAISTVGYTALGSLWGVGKGIVHAEKAVSENTFDKMSEGNPMLGPVGVVGSILALPVGAIQGVTLGAGQGFVSGFMAPEAF